METCAVCNLDFKQIGVHAYYAHKMPKQKYFDKYKKKPEDGICFHCKNPTKFLDIKNGYRKYCHSPRCSALGEGKGKWMAGRPLLPNVKLALEKEAIRRRGRTYKEIYGESAEKERLNRTLSNRRTFSNKPYRQVSALAIERAKERKGKTYQEIYGDRAEEESRKRRDTHRKKWEGVPRKKHCRSHHNNDWRYTNWRTLVFERDSYLCQMCHNPKRGNQLQAHHIKYWSTHPRLRYVIDNGITLCKDCHKRRHRLDRWYRRYRINPQIRKRINQLKKLYR